MKHAQTSTPGFFQPRHYFLVAGVGDEATGLVAFDRTLIAAGVADVNLLKLSSIVGPECERIDPVPLTPGSFVGVAYASVTSDRPGERIASAVAVAHPSDPRRAALVMEHSAVGSTKEEVEHEVVCMAIAGLASRGLKPAHIEAISTEHVVERVGATFAAVVEV